MDKIDKVELLLENMQDDLRSVLEVTTSNAKEIIEVKDRLEKVENKIDEINAIKIVTKDNSKQLQEHEQRLNYVEKQIA